MLRQCALADRASTTTKRRVSTPERRGTGDSGGYY